MRINPQWKQAEESVSSSGVLAVVFSEEKHFLSLLFSPPHQINNADLNSYPDQDLTSDRWNNIFTVLAHTTVAPQSAVPRSWPSHGGHVV